MATQSPMMTKAQHNRIVLGLVIALARAVIEINKESRNERS
jgi:hypothetical protein